MPRRPTRSTRARSYQGFASGPTAELTSHDDCQVSLARRCGRAVCSSVQITLDRYSHIMPHMAAALAERMDAAYRARADHTTR